MLELWKPVVGYEGLYEVSDQGNVKSLPREVPVVRTGVDYLRVSPGRLLKRGKASGNRWNVVLCRQGTTKTCLVAHLVAAAFLGPANGLQVLHKNDVTTDDRVENLRYGTHAENMGDKVLNGLSNRGAKHHKAKLTEDQARAIKTRSQTEDTRTLAKEFGVSPNTIQAIKHGYNWSWLK
jgi:hypothetical protein